MPALKSLSFFRRVLLALLVSVLVLTHAASASAQGQTTDPYAKQKPAGGVRSQLPQALAPAQGATAANIIKDPSFESAYNSQANWTQYSENYFTPLCVAADCGNGAGTAGPRSGSVWAWFGGINFSVPGAVNPEFAYLQQQVTIPSCGATLKFYLWIGAAATGSGTDDYFIAQLGSTHLFRANATQKNTYPSYKLVTVNIAPGTYVQPIPLYFFSEISDQLVTFNLDDISLTPNCLIISGYAGIGGATINYTGGSTTAAFDGYYSFNVPVGWSGTVTPSKSGYTFSPGSRTYTNLASYQPGQNYTATRIMRSISGNTGVADTILSYVNFAGPQFISSQSNGNYSLNVEHNWSGTVTPLHDCFTFDPVDRSYNNVVSNQTAQNYTATFNAGSGCANINARIGDVNHGQFGLLPGASTRASFAGLNNGPVNLSSANDIPLIGAERVIYTVKGVQTSFTEMMGLPDGQLDNIYWLPWYNNVNLDTQLRIANATNNPATVTVTIGDVAMPALELAGGESTRVSYEGVNDGPVKIESNQDIVAAERVIYKVNNIETSFSELMALPESQLDNVYWLPWYNNVNLDTQLRIGNVSGSTATVHVFIGGEEVTPVEGITLLEGESTRLSYAGVNDGPVKIVSDQNIVAAERVIYNVSNVQTSFSEMMGLPENQLDTTYWLPWYNNVNLDTQLRLANTTNQLATVHIYIGNDEMPGSPFTLGAGESTRVSYPGVNDGPVQIVSDRDIVVAERVIYEVKGIQTSFTEMMALPESQLDTTYWFPWYNNVGSDTQLRFGVP